LAGINAALKLRQEAPLILGRDEAYIGVLIDDLVTKGTNEPYRLFTSRAEHRLLLRHDNADLRLMTHGHRIGLLPEALYRRMKQKQLAIEQEVARLRTTRLTLADVEQLRQHGVTALNGGEPLAQLLKRPEIGYGQLSEWLGWPDRVTPEVEEQVEIELVYEGYIERQRREVERLRQDEHRLIPPMFDYDRVIGLSAEVRQKLRAISPRSLGQAARISGVTPAALSLLMIALQRNQARHRAAQNPAASGTTPRSA
jgi:tRNA uridine 5-carboxymethylaminomethyl modification enzyme